MNEMIQQMAQAMSSNDFLLFGAQLKSKHRPIAKSKANSLHNCLFKCSF